MSTFRFGTHMPVLIKAVEKTKGAILELGLGHSSTIYLHWACYHLKRPLVTMENSKRFYQKFKNLNSDYHKLIYVEDWNKVDMSGNWSVVLIDQSPGYQRGVDLLKFVNAEYILCHDTQLDKNKDSYGYNFSPYKYRFEYIPELYYHPRTMVLSNIHNLERFME